MGARKRSRPSAAVKDSSKRHHFRNRSQIRKVQIINKQLAKLSFLSKGAKAQSSKPLVEFFRRGGMAYGQSSILRTVHKDNQLRRKLLNLGIRNRKGVEEALLELLYHFRNLKDWDSGDDDLFDVFRLLKGRVKWAASCSVDLIMQLFFALLRARLDYPHNLRTKNCCKVALRVDKVISVSIIKQLYLLFSDVHLSFLHATFLLILQPIDIGSLQDRLRHTVCCLALIFLGRCSFSDLKAKL